MRKVFKLLIAFGLILALASGAWAYTIEHGPYNSYSPHRVDLNAVADFKAKIQAISGVANNTWQIYYSPQLSIWTELGGWQEGGAFYVTTKISDLPADWTVTIDNNYLYRDIAGGVSDFVSFWDPVPYTVSGPDLTGASGNRIRDWIRYSEPGSAAGLYNLYLSSGLYDLLPDGPPPYNYYDLRLMRTVTINDANCEPVAQLSLTNTATLGTPEPGSLLLLGSAAGALAFFRRRRRRR